MAVNTFAINGDAYASATANFGAAAGNLNPSWVEAPVLSSNVLTIKEYVTVFKSISDVLKLYNTMLGNDTKMFQEIQDSYAAADAKNVISAVQR